MFIIRKIHFRLWRPSQVVAPTRKDYEDFGSQVADLQTCLCLTSTRHQTFQPNQTSLWLTCIHLNNSYAVKPALLYDAGIRKLLSYKCFKLINTTYFVYGVNISSILRVDKNFTAREMGPSEGQINAQFYYQQSISTFTYVETQSTSSTTHHRNKTLVRLIKWSANDFLRNLFIH